VTDDPRKQINEVFEGLGWKDSFTIKLNSRLILDGLFEVCGVPENLIRPISSAVDKLDVSKNTPGVPASSSTPSSKDWGLAQAAVRDLTNVCARNHCGRTCVRRWWRRSIWIRKLQTRSVSPNKSAEGWPGTVAV